MVAGSVGVVYSSSGREAAGVFPDEQDRRRKCTSVGDEKGNSVGVGIDTLQPYVGWFVYEVPGKERPAFDDVVESVYVRKT
jgi:hypothetical protein